MEQKNERNIVKKSLIQKAGEWLSNGIVNDISKSKKSWLKKRARSIILKFTDPDVSVRVGNINLKMSLSQRTPFLYALHPMYDRALPRICKAIQQIDRYLTVIDIGANIGDTAHQISEKVSDANILCIEGEKKFLRFLYENSSTINNNTIFIEPKFCANTLDNSNFSVENKKGTAHLSFSDSNKLENIDTLDNMINNNNIFQTTNIIKIDTDGFEIMVLNGAKEMLKNIHPVIYFEFTPDIYLMHKQNPMDLINLLVAFGYNKALFYDNLGTPLGMYNFTDTAGMIEMISKIDNMKIAYYDILCIHSTDEEKYLSVLESELNSHENTTY